MSCKACSEPAGAKDASVKCDNCLSWFHDDCSGMLKGDLRAIRQKNTMVLWHCQNCKTQFRSRDSASSPLVQFRDDVLHEKIDCILKSLSLFNDRISSVEAKLDDHIKEVSDRITDSESHITTVDQKYEIRLAELHEKVSSINLLAASNGRSSSEQCAVNLGCDQIERLTDRVESMERLNRRCDLIIDGIPAVNRGAEGESLIEVVSAIAKHYNLALSTSDIIFCNRLRHGGTANKNKSKPESILVRFQQQSARDVLFNNYLKERNLSLLDIIPSIGIQSRVYIGENTTPACRMLIKRCAIMRKNSLIHRYHTRQGRLFIQRVPDGPLQPVTAGILDKIEKEPPINQR